MPTMDELVELSQAKLSEAMKLIPGKVPEADGHGPSVEATLSNHELLLKHVGTFYESKDSGYFPRDATNAIFGALTNANASWDNVATNHANGQDYAANGRKYLNLCDKAYALCLSYGVTTYGFREKDLTNLLEEARSESRNVRKKSKELFAEMEELSESLDTTHAEQVEKPTKEAMARLSAAIASLETQATGLLKDLGEKRTALEGKITATGAMAEQLEGSIESAEAIAEKLGQIRTTADEEVASCAKAKGEAVADAKVVNQLRSDIKAQLEGVTEFFGKIGSHETKMAEIQNSAEVRYGELVTKTRADLEKSQADSGTIVTRVKTQQDQIDDHLNRAVGASLFTAFDKRRETLSTGTRTWLLLLVLAITAAVWLTFQLAGDVRGDWSKALEIGFFIKLSAAVPVAFGLAFAAKQYGQERKAEEEYAFKSVISVSLEPYEKLLKRLKDDGHADAEFVKRLMMEIFDNPVKRMYPAPEKTGQRAKGLSGRELKDLLEKVATKLDDEDVKKVKDMIFARLEI